VAAHMSFVACVSPHPGFIFNNLMYMYVFVFIDSNHITGMAYHYNIDKNLIDIDTTKFKNMIIKLGKTYYIECLHFVNFIFWRRAMPSTQQT